MANISLVTFAAKTVTPQDDALIYESALGAGGIIYGAEVTQKNANTLHISAGHGVIAGRKFTIFDSDIPVVLSTVGQILGRLYIHLDLSNASEPIELLVETGQTLSPLVQDENVNIVNGEFDINIAQFTVSTSTIDNLRNVYPKVKYANSGSIIRISTLEPSLVGEEVTITDGTNYVYAVFDANGNAELTNVLMTGTLTVSATDGTDTASATLNVPYYGAYDLSLAFWNATLNITTQSSELYGQTVSIYDSDETFVGSAMFSGLGVAQFIVKEPDTYTCSVDYGGNTYSSQVTVTAQTTYNVFLNVGFIWTNWLTLGGVDPSGYSSLNDVFADEPTVRELMLKHDSADYLVDSVTDNVNIIDDFCANDTAMKWIGLCDYVCDKLTAINGVEAKFMASTYWERYLKDHVPVMTANNAPYGTASATGSSANAYKVFDGNDSTDLELNGVSGGLVFYQYEFTNPINVKKVKIRNGGEAYSVLTYDLLVSNDGSNFTALTKTDSTSGLEIESEVEGEDFYKYVRVKPLTTTGKPSAGVAANTYADVVTIQFYGRQLSVSVPVMTGNTTPYGEASASGANSGYEAYKAFAPSGYWVTSGASAWIQYHFPSKMCPKMLDIQCGSGNRLSTYSLKGSNDGSDFSAEITSGTNSTSGTVRIIKNFLANMDEYEYLRLAITSNESASGEIVQMQFYGVDYSEKEFEQGTTRKWLYDHGVELEPLEKVNSFTAGITKENDDILFDSNSSSTGNGVTTSSAIDVTNYSTMRAKMGDVIGAAIYCGIYTTKSPSWWSPTATNNYSLGDADLPDNLALPINNVNGNNYPMVVQSYPSSGSKLVEFWCE